MFRRLLLLGGTLAGLLALPISVSHAAINSGTFIDNESDYDVPTGITVNRGDTVRISCSGSIWAGVFLTGRNGPQGWDNINYNSKYPKPGTHPYMQLGKLDQGYFDVGVGKTFVHTGLSAELKLRINDDTPGNGNGAFTCDVNVTRATS